MSVKIYGVSLNDIKVSKDLDVPLGPGFYINTSRSPIGTYPTLADSTSLSTENGRLGAYFRVNMGQYAFDGDPLGFQPYDVNYDPQLWEGPYTSLEDDLILLRNISGARYNKTYTTGKYYYEVEYIRNSRYDNIGLTTTDYILDHSSGYSGYNRFGIGLNGVGSYRGTSILTARGDYGLTGTETPWTTYSVLDGDIVQVWVDFDNGLVCVKKLGTTKEDHVNYIEF